MFCWLLVWFYNHERHEKLCVPLCSLWLKSATLVTGVSSAGGGGKQRWWAVCVVVLVEAWSRFAQPYSAFDMGDLRVLQMTRQSLDWPRHRVLHKSPHLKSLRSAPTPIKAKSALFDTVRHTLSLRKSRPRSSRPSLSRQFSTIRVAILPRLCALLRFAH